MVRWINHTSYVCDLENSIDQSLSFWPSKPKKEKYKFSDHLYMIIPLVNTEFKAGRPIEWPRSKKLSQENLKIHFNFLLT